MTEERRWLNELLIAVVDQDAEKISDLYYKLPQGFNSYDDLLEARTLIEEALKILSQERNRLQKQMQSLRQNKHYLEQQAKNSPTNRFDKRN